MRRTVVTLVCFLVVGAAPALGGTDPWTDGWYANGDLGCTGITGDNMTTFSPNDPRLGANTGGNGTTSGGISYAYAEHGAYNGGDNARVLMNMDMNVPAGQYSFEVTINSLIYWDQYGDRGASTRNGTSATRRTWTTATGRRALLLRHPVPGRAAVGATTMAPFWPATKMAPTTITLL